MSDKDKVLKSLVRGAGILFIGTIVGYLFRFIYRVVVSRYAGPENYGLLSLGEMVLNIGILMALIGVNLGVVKFMSHYISLNQYNKAKGSFFAALKITSILGLIVTVLLVIFSEIISVKIFNNELLTPIFIVFSLTIPVYGLLLIFSRALIALKKPEYQFFSVTIGRNFSALIFTIIVILLEGSVLHISIASLVSFIIALVIAFFLVEKKAYSFFRSKIEPVYNYKELLYFSMPLFFSAVFVNIMNWADTFLIGSMKTITDVGVYNVAMPLAASLAMFLSAFASMFFPIMNELKARNEIDKIGETYSLVMKWLYLFSLPGVLLVILFPRQILNILFGESYVVGSSVLVILIIANFINVILGPANQVLMTFDRTKFIFGVNSTLVVLNIILNIILIPKFGIEGAAYATAVSLVLRQLIIFLTARRVLDFGFGWKYYLKYSASAFIPLALLFVLVRTFFQDPNFYVLVVSGVMFFVLYGIFLLLFRSFSREDIMIMNAVEKKLGVNLSFLKRFLH